MNFLIWLTYMLQTEYTVQRLSIKTKNLFMVRKKIVYFYGKKKVCVFLWNFPINKFGKIVGLQS